MKTFVLFPALLVCAAPLCAQPQPVQRAEPIVKRVYELDAPLVSSAQAQKLALPDDIQIHLRDVTLRQALQELEKQSGLPFDLSALPREKLDAKMSIDVDTPSVTRAFNAIADEANLKLSLAHGHAYDEWDVSEIQGKPEPRFAPVVADGLFETRLLKVDVSRFKQLNLDAAKPVRTQDDALNLTLEMTPDPGWPLGGLPVLRAIKAEDDQGRSLLDLERAPKKLAYDAGFLDAWSKKTATVQLRPPEPDARRIAVFKGEALYMIAVKRALWEIPDLLGKKQPTYHFVIGDAEVTTTLSEVKLEGETVRLRLELALPPGTSWQNFSGNTYSLYGAITWLTVEDANGVRLTPQGGGGSSGSNKFSANVSFVLPNRPREPGEKRKLALPLNFRFEPPTEWVQAQVKFQFADVPLP